MFGQDERVNDSQWQMTNRYSLASDHACLASCRARLLAVCSDCILSIRPVVEHVGACACLKCKAHLSGQ